MVTETGAGSHTCSIRRWSSRSLSCTSWGGTGDAAAWSTCRGDSGHRDGWTGAAADSGVFLLSRIKEARDGGASNADAVAIGLERVGRITTAAALLFAVAIGAFVTSGMIFLKELGLGTALAVLIDAPSSVRCSCPR